MSLWDLLLFDTILLQFAASFVLKLSEGTDAVRDLVAHLRTLHLNAWKKACVGTNVICSAFHDTHSCSVWVWYDSKSSQQKVCFRDANTKTSTPMILTQHQPRCFPRGANGTSSLAEVSCASKQKGFPPGVRNSKQGWSMVQKQYLIEWLHVTQSSPSPGSHFFPPCPSPRPPQWSFHPHSAPPDPTQAPRSRPSEGNGSSW